MAQYERLFHAAINVLQTHENEPLTFGLNSAAWLRREADRMEAKDAAIKELKAAVEDFSDQLSAESDDT